MPPNAFAVTLFCLDGFFASRAADFLPHAFAKFPDRDYCVLTVPSSAPECSSAPRSPSFLRRRRSTSRWK